MITPPRHLLSFGSQPHIVLALFSLLPADILSFFCCSNKFFETFSYLPPLSENEIAKQVDYIVNNGFIPSLEFAEAEQAYAGTEITRLSQPGYYDNRCVALPIFCSFRPG